MQTQQQEMASTDAQASVVKADASVVRLLTPQVNAAIGEFMHEHEIDADHLLRLFRQAFMPVESLSATALLVTAESGMRLSINVDAPRHLLALRTRYTLRADAEMQAKVDFAHRANNGVIAVRFAIDSPGTMQGELTLLTQGGLITRQLMDGVRLLSNVVRGAIRDFDTDRVVS